MQTPNKPKIEIKKEWIQAALCVLIFLIAGAVYLVSRKPDVTPSLEWESEIITTIEKEVTTLEVYTIYVHIAGEVMHPGVYAVEAGTRLGELLTLAGGPTENADADACNLASVVEDGQRIQIPSWEEAIQIASEEQNRSDGKININTASIEELMTLPGVGEAKATDIITYRENYGSFQNIEDIMKISGIKEAAFQKIKDYIVTE